MLYGETVAVYCENRTEHTDTLRGSLYLTGNTLRLRYRAQPVNAVWGNSRCFENRTEHTDSAHCVGRLSCCRPVEPWQSEISVQMRLV
jgi:hypothetical protein